MKEITVKIIDILESGHWTEFCDKYGINEWCINEGLADEDTTTKISIEDAELYGLLLF